MGSSFRIALGLLWMALLVAVPAVACSQSAVTLDRLVEDQERFVGDEVTVTGWVASFIDPDGSEYFVLEDADANRVLLLPDDIAASHAGSRVEVTGRFDFDANRGRTLRIEDIEAVPD